MNNHGPRKDLDGEGKMPMTDALHNLGELLAVIHRDGGHYVQEHGVDKATKDAIAVVIGLRTEIETLQKEVKNPHRHSISGEDYIFVLHDEWEKLRAENEKLRAENEMLRANADRWCFWVYWNRVDPTKLPQVDEFIHESEVNEITDKAMAALRGEGER